MSKLSRLVQPDRGELREQMPPNMVRGVVDSTVDGVLRVIVPSFADDRVFEIVRGDNTLTPGTEVLIAFDDEGEPWQIAPPYIEEAQ